MTNENLLESSCFPFGNRSGGLFSTSVALIRPATGVDCCILLRSEFQHPSEEPHSQPACKQRVFATPKTNQSAKAAYSLSYLIE
jgi:hypothetical protein